MRIYVDNNECELLVKALLCLRAHYPHSYGFSCQNLLEKIATCCEKQKSGALDCYGIMLGNDQIRSRCYSFREVK